MFTIVDIACWFASFCTISAAICGIHAKAAYDEYIEEKETR